MTGPAVAVLMPVRDEQDNIAACLESVRAQTYPLKEVLVIDGGSTDGTVDVVSKFSFVRVLHNPAGSQAHGLNLGIAEATADVMVRVDARTRIAPDYVAACVTALAETSAAVVGGAMTPVPASTPASRAIALAMASRVGAGPARFHRSDARPGWVDTVYLGAFRMDVVRRVGGYDVRQRTNEDAELAHRLRPFGGVWFDTKIRSEYVARSSLRDVAVQFYRYGAGRAASFRKDPRSAAVRQLLPIALVLSFVSPWRGPVSIAYASVVGVKACIVAPRDPQAAIRLAAVLPVMHFSWAFGFGREAVRWWHPRR